MNRPIAAHRLAAIVALLLGSLACATLQPEYDDFPPPPATILVRTEAPEDVEETATPSAEDETEPAETEAVDEVPTAADSDVGDVSSCANPPEDVPVMDVSTMFTYCDATTLSFQTSDATYDEVLAYYKSELDAAGWDEDTANLSIETGDTAVLYYVKDDRQISVTVSYNSTDQSTTLLVYVTP